MMIAYSFAFHSIWTIFLEWSVLLSVFVLFLYSAATYVNNIVDNCFKKYIVSSISDVQK